MKSIFFAQTCLLLSTVSFVRADPAADARAALALSRPVATETPILPVTVEPLAPVKVRSTVACTCQTGGGEANCLCLQSGLPCTCPGGVARTFGQTQEYEWRRWLDGETECVYLFDLTNQRPVGVYRFDRGLYWRCVGQSGLNLEKPPITPPKSVEQVKAKAKQEPAVKPLQSYAAPVYDRSFARFSSFAGCASGT